MSKILRHLFAVLCFFLLSHSQAAVEVAAGVSSTTSGRFVPALVGGISGSGWAVTGSANGVQNDYYYQSVYTLNYYKTWNSGKLFWGEVVSGFGAGAMYGLRGFQDENSANEKEVSDYALGPAFHVRWSFASPVYMNMEMIWGLRDFLNLVTLNGQDVVVFSVGVQSW